MKFEGDRIKFTRQEVFDALLRGIDPQMTKPYTEPWGLVFIADDEAVTDLVVHLREPEKPAEDSSAPPDVTDYLDEQEEADEAPAV